MHATTEMLECLISTLNYNWLVIVYELLSKVPHDYGWPTKVIPQFNSRAIVSASLLFDVTSIIVKLRFIL